MTATPFLIFILAALAFLGGTRAWQNGEFTDHMIGGIMMAGSLALLALALVISFRAV